jgi:hypothetical protein
MDNHGLRQRIAVASAPDEVEALIKLGLGFEYASDRTRNAWGHTARRRYKELTKQDMEVPKMTQPKQINRNNLKRKQRKNA